MELESPWEDVHPKLSAWTRSLSIPRIDALEADPFSAPTHPFYSLLREHTSSSTQLGFVPKQSLSFTNDRRLSYRVKSRKWSQICSFVSSVASVLSREANEVVDWCAGKGHLGRALGATLDRSVLLLERQPDLCQRGKQQTEGLPNTYRFVEQDVLDDSVEMHLHPKQFAVGLHACGLLTDQLLKQVTRRGLRGVAVAPCCHHYIGTKQGSYSPMSCVARSLDLELDEKLLRLSIADEVLAPPRERRARRHELNYRLGFDLLVREATGEDRYFSLGILPKGICKQTFAEFCREVSKRKNLPLPSYWDASKAEQAGMERGRLARGRALVRSLFRRPLELWLVLDRALYLSEHGLTTQVGLFCERTLTPRNLLVTGVNNKSA